MVPIPSAGMCQPGAPWGGSWLLAHAGTPKARVGQLWEGIELHLLKPEAALSSFSQGTPIPQGFSCRGQPI